MTISKSPLTIPVERIEKSIFLIRDEKVMLDRDLAKLYGVTTSALKQAVRRHSERFPPDFMFVLSLSELQAWRSQIVISKADRMGLRHAPMAFTEQGVAMLSSVLHSKRAVVVNVQIMRAFVQLRQMLASNADLSKKLEELERKYDHQFKIVFDAIRQLMIPAPKNPKPIGFRSLSPKN
jgi:hypothetical protein